MEKETIVVPKGIRYINQWKEFSLPNHPCIINKTITGCGFTEYCLTSPDNVILCSPRKVLLENKEEQHKGEVFYARSGLEKSTNFEKDLTATKKSKEQEKLEDVDLEQIKTAILNLKDRISEYYVQCGISNKPCKIIVTYDSFRHVKEALGENIKYFYVVIDEFQSVFTDAKFKSTTEIEFMSQLGGIQNLSFVSATPMIDKYLEMLDEFKNLPYYELDWKTEDPSRIVKPQLSIHSCNSKGIIKTAGEIIEDYKQGNFDSTVINLDGKLISVESKEAVIYVNSVKNICDIISKNNLTLDNTNIICSRSDYNELKLLRAFGYKSAKDLKTKTGLDSCIGKVPVKGETNKMFTLCTRTVYLGADFYSDNAKTYIFSDANVDSLTVDITIDLPQILGRQRLEENPWKNKADLYYKTLREDKEVTFEDFSNTIKEKVNTTESLLRSYSKVLDQDKHKLAEAYQKLAKSFNYLDDYVAVNTHNGKDLVPTFNNLVMVNDLRSYELQQIDYRDRFSVFSSIGQDIDDDSTIVSKELSNIESISKYENKMKYIYSLDYNEEIMKNILGNLYDTSFSKYYWTISKERASALKYQKGNLEKEYNRLYGNITGLIEGGPSVEDKIYDLFSIGSRYSKAEIKEKLRNLYLELRYDKTPKANDLEIYFVIKVCQIKNKETGKLDNGFEILKKKGD